MRRPVTAVLSAVILGSSVGVTSTAVAAPGAEHIPATVDRARIDYTDMQDASQNQHIRLHGKRAQHLVALFDDLKREPRRTAQCEIASSSKTTVTFRGPHHTWVATEAVCSNIGVTRDGEGERTLLPSKAWNAALARYLGHSPVAPAARPIG